MSRWILRGEEAWGELLRSYQRSSFRLEAQQVYSNPEENELLERFLSGTLTMPSWEWRLSRSRERMAAGATKITVRVVVEPQTDYTRMELAIYPGIVAAGEDVRVIPVARGEWPDGLPHHDFFLFDERQVWHMHYNDDLTFRGAELREEDDVLAEHLRWRDVALGLAMPLLDYPGVEPLPA